MDSKSSDQDTWNQRATTWHRNVNRSDAFDQIRTALLAAANPRSTDRVVELGAGSGFVTLALAPVVKCVVAVDYAEDMLELLRGQLGTARVSNVTVTKEDLETFDMPPKCVDLVVSNYALHHLTDEGKVRLVRRAATWLRPGGRFVVADMMFGRGRTARDRAIFKTKVRQLGTKGPAGLWRIAKNTLRFGLGVGDDHPAAPSFWVDTLHGHGFTQVDYRPLVAEAGLVSGVLPYHPTATVAS